MGYDYDTKEGIEKLLENGLAGLNDLRHARAEAGYGRGERMETWIILGRWVTDACGNFGRILDGAPADAYRYVPPVMTMEEWRERAARLEWSGTSSHIPPAHVRCVECQKPFTVEDAHTVQQTNRDANESIPQHTGRTIREVDAEWQWVSALQTRRIIGLTNSAWVDLTPHKDAATRDYAKDWVVNKDGWRECGNKTCELLVSRDEVIPPESVAHFAVFEWHHAECLAKLDRDRERAFFDGVLKDAGFCGYALREIPNEYWLDGRRGERPAPPWFEVDVPDFGRLKIGWRKRVINIDWSAARDVAGRKGANSDALDGAKLFADEGVTVGRTYVHAWDKEKCVEYLKKLKEAAG